MTVMRWWLGGNLEQLAFQAASRLGTDLMSTVVQVVQVSSRDPTNIRKHKP